MTTPTPVPTVNAPAPTPTVAPVSRPTAAPVPTPAGTATPPSGANGNVSAPVPAGGSPVASAAAAGAATGPTDGPTASGPVGPDGNPTPARTGAKRGRKPLADDPRKPYPALEVDAQGNATKKIESVPADYNDKEFLPLRRADFAEEWQFMVFSADRYEAKAAQLRKEAEVAKQLGTKEERSKATRLLSLTKQMEELRKSLAASGVNVDQLLSSGK